FPDAHAVGEQPSVVPACEERNPWMVVASGHENANVHAVSCRSVQGFDLGGGWREVRGRDPDRALRGNRLDLERARHAQSQRLALDDADERWRVRRGIEMGVVRVAPQKAMGSAPFGSCGSSPHVVEGELHVAGGGAVDANRCVAPAGARAFLDACRPFAADADAARDAYVPVHDEQLAMISRHESEPAMKAGRIEHRDLDAPLPQLAQKTLLRAANADG